MCSDPRCSDLSVSATAMSMEMVNMFDTKGDLNREKVYSMVYTSKLFDTEKCQQNKYLVQPFSESMCAKLYSNVRNKFKMKVEDCYSTIFKLFVSMVDYFENTFVILFIPVRIR